MAGGRNLALSARGAVWNSRSRTAAGSLFERLLIDEEDLDVLAYDSRIDALLRSIKRNLDRALNIHAGGAAANPLVGVTDFNDSTVNSNDVADHMTAAIKSCIQAAEPRISCVDVKHIPDPEAPLLLKFAVLCSIDVDDVHEQIRIDMAMRDGRIHQLG
ncbi:type VI secretion system baseplate subunit TssE [Neorhizobium sp. T786]|uniref:type VI secretion system baseplate subunit TssE n=1 Tax=Pseudorhizobium xiangyangii TaxID=2883104 RepID=UPI001CFF9821|nr:type VI secretion system baseplate subunit TssE [Neorhizobium xiangyangii]MCB5205263.1 type VI secretion system baseplate subunit TssE [Neorhizobium xiangyangii]